MLSMASCPKGSSHPITSTITWILIGIICIILLLIIRCYDSSRHQDQEKQTKNVKDLRLHGSVKNQMGKMLKSHTLYAASTDLPEAKLELMDSDTLRQLSFWHYFDKITPMKEDVIEFFS